VSVIAPLRTLRLVGLFTPELRRLGIPPEEMFQPHDSVYSVAEMRGGTIRTGRDRLAASTRHAALRGCHFSVESVRLVADPCSTS
jgi:hypothetical protein